MKVITSSHVFYNNRFCEGLFLIFDDNNIIKEVVINPDYYIDGVKHYDGLLVPGFVNAHCHLELSHLKQVIPRNTSMAEFARQIITNRFQETEHQKKYIYDAINDIYDSGTVLVGDISNEQIMLEMKSEFENQIVIHTFWELFGLDEEKSIELFNYGLSLNEKYRLNFSLTPHAPYSVLPDLLQKIVDCNIKNETRLSIHALESEDEMNYFKDFSGNFPDFFSRLGYPKKIKYNHPLDYLLTHFTEELKVMYVHATEAKPEDLERIKTSTPDYFICLCPRSNEYIHNKLPDLSIFDAERLCLGTDSLASNTDLSILQEILCLQRAFPDFPLEMLLNMATCQGAEALSFDGRFGQFKRGFQPGALLIHGFDPKSTKLHQESTVLRLI